MTQTNEELRQEIKHKLYGVILDIQSDYQQFFENKKNVFLQSYWENKIMEVIEPYLIPQPEQVKASNHMSLVNGSATHCKECGKEL